MDVNEPMTLQETTDLLLILTIQIIKAVEPDDKKGDIALEGIANGLLDFANKLPSGRQRDIFVAMAKSLIETEDGAGYG